MQKQQLGDFEHLLEIGLSTYLILCEEGTEKQAERAKAKALSDLMRYRSDMEAIGRDLGEGLPEIIRNYIKSMHEIVRGRDNLIDPAQIHEHRNGALRLKRQLKIDAA